MPRVQKICHQLVLDPSPTSTPPGAARLCFRSLAPLPSRASHTASNAACQPSIVPGAAYIR